MAVTAKEIAARLGLSASAVSLALNGKPGISEQTRAKIVALAAQLGYRLPSSAQNSANQKKTVCFALYADHTVEDSSGHSSYISPILKGVEAEATANSFHTVIRYLSSAKPLDRQVAGVLEEANAIILLGTDITAHRRREIEDLLDRAGSVPIVMVDNFLFSEKVDCVGNDNLNGALSLARHLLERGCRRIGYLRARQRLESFDKREKGLREAMEAEGLTFSPVLAVDISSENAFADIEHWLESEPELPEAFIAENDVIAAAAIRALTQRGVRIPEQLMIAGFDDTPVSTMIAPPLTSVHVYQESIGRSAVKIICQRLAAGQNTFTSRRNGLLKVELSTHLCVRKSTTRDS